MQAGQRRRAGRFWTKPALLRTVLVGKGENMKIIGLLLGLMLLSGCVLKQHCEGNLGDLTRTGCAEWAWSPKRA